MVIDGGYGMWVLIIDLSGDEPSDKGGKGSRIFKISIIDK
jgi:hypothetical protein